MIFRAMVLLVIGILFRAFYQCVYWICRAIPGRTRIVFLSRQGNTPSGDQLRVVHALRQKNPQIRVTQLNRRVRSRFDVAYAFHLIRQTWHVAHAQTVVLDSFSLITSNAKLASHTRVIQMWHALGSFKRFGWDAVGPASSTRALTAHALRMHAGNDVVLASSARSVPHFASAFAIDSSRVRVCPLPRIDALGDAAAIAHTRQRIVAALQLDPQVRTLIYAPTLQRQSDPATLHALSDFCQRSNIRLVVSRHPVDLPTPPEFGTEELLTVADIFVTDRSSLVYEAGWMGIPSFILVPGEGFNQLVRESYLREEDLAPLHITSPEEMPERIESGQARTAALTFAHAFIEPPSNASCAETIADICLEGNSAR